MENKKSFLAMNTGFSLDKDGKVIPYAFLVEGIVTNVGNFREASEGKPSILNLSVLVGRNPWALLGKDVEAEQKDNTVINAEHPFVNLSIFGQDAGRLKDIQKNAKVIFCGRPVKNNYKKKGTGEDVTAVVVNVDTIYQAQTKYGDADDLRRWVPSMVNRFESQGEARTQNLGMLSCEVVKFNGVQQTPSGQDVASARVRLAVPALEAEARINREYNKETDYGSYMEASISVWGPRASKMEKILASSNQLVVTATAKKNVSDNGKSYVNLTARDISILKWGAPASSDKTPAESDASDESENYQPGYDADNQGFNAYAVMDDGDDLDLPF